MAIEKAKEFFRERGMEDRVLEFDASSATVELAAAAVGCEPARIAKTLSFHVDGQVALVVAAGDARIDNQKFKAEFQTKAKMLKTEEVEPLVGHGVGGVCPFAVNEGCNVYLDDSLRRFDVVYPACGSASSAIGLTLSEAWRRARSRAAGWTSAHSPDADARFAHRDHARDRRGVAVQENFRSLKRSLPFDRGRLRSFRASLLCAAAGCMQACGRTRLPKEGTTHATHRVRQQACSKHRCRVCEFRSPYRLCARQPFCLSWPRRLASLRRLRPVRAQRFPLCEGFLGRPVLPQARSWLAFAPAERRIDHQALCDHGRSAGGGCRGSGRLRDGGSGLHGRRHGVGPGRDRRVHQHAGGRVEPRAGPPAVSDRSRLGRRTVCGKHRRRSRMRPPPAWPWST